MDLKYPQRPLTAEQLQLQLQLQSFTLKQLFSEESCSVLLQ